MEQQSLDLSEVYFLVLHWLAHGPCQRAAQALLEDVQEQGLLPHGFSVNGSSRTLSYDQVQQQHRGVPPSGLVQLLQQSLTRVQQSGFPGAEGLQTLLAEGNLAALPSLARSARSLQPRWPSWLSGHGGGVSLPQQQLLQEAGVARGGSSRRVPLQLAAARFCHHATFRGHGFPVFALLFDKEGRRVITGADDAVIKIWSVQTGLLLVAARGHTGEVTDLSLSADGQLLASAATDAEVRVWSMQRHDLGQNLAVLRGHSAPVNLLAFHPHIPSALLSASMDGTLRLWDASDQHFASLVLQPSSSSAAAAAGADVPSQEGAAAAAVGASAGSRRAAARAASAAGNRGAAGRAADEVDESNGMMWCGWSPDGDLIVAGSRNSSVYLWEWTVISSTQQQHHQQTLRQLREAFPQSADWPLPVQLQELTGHTSDLIQAEFSHGGRMIATAANDGTVRIWGQQHTIQHSAQQEAAAWKQTCPPLQVTPLPEAAGAGAGAGGGANAARQRQRKQQVQPLSIHKLAWVADDSQVLAVAADNAIRVWCPYTGSLLRLLQGHRQSVHVLTAHPFDRRLVLSAGYDGAIILWDAGTGTQLKRFSSSDTPPLARGSWAPPVIQLVDGRFSADGNLFAVSDVAGQFSLYGLGPPPPLILAAPYDQFFLRDYDPIVLDEAGFAAFQDPNTGVVVAPVWQMSGQQTGAVGDGSIGVDQRQPQPLCDNHFKPYPEDFQAAYRAGRVWEYVSSSRGGMSLRGSSMTLPQSLELWPPTVTSAVWQALEDRAAMAARRSSVPSEESVRDMAERKALEAHSRLLAALARGMTLQEEQEHLEQMAAAAAAAQQQQQQQQAQLRLQQQQQQQLRVHEMPARPATAGLQEAGAAGSAGQQQGTELNVPLQANPENEQRSGRAMLQEVLQAQGNLLASHQPQEQQPFAAAGFYTDEEVIEMLDDREVEGAQDEQNNSDSDYSASAFEDHASSEYSSDLDSRDDGVNSSSGYSSDQGGANGSSRRNRHGRRQRQKSRRQKRQQRHAAAAVAAGGGAGGGGHNLRPRRQRGLSYDSEDEEDREQAAETRSRPQTRSTARATPEFHQLPEDQHEQQQQQRRSTRQRKRRMRSSGPEDGPEEGLEQYLHHEDSESEDADKLRQRQQRQRRVRSRRQAAAEDAAMHTGPGAATAVMTAGSLGLQQQSGGPDAAASAVGQCPANGTDGGAAPANAAGAAGAASGQTPKAEVDILRQPRPESCYSWLQLAQHIPNTYVPQQGDAVVYLWEGHQKYLSAVSDQSSSRPWQEFSRLGLAAWQQQQGQVQRQQLPAQPQQQQEECRDVQQQVHQHEQHQHQQWDSSQQQLQQHNAAVISSVAPGEVIGAADAAVADTATPAEVLPGPVAANSGAAAAAGAALQPGGIEVPSSAPVPAATWGPGASSCYPTGAKFTEAAAAANATADVAAVGPGQIARASLDHLCTPAAAAAADAAAKAPTVAPAGVAENATFDAATGAAAVASSAASARPFCFRPAEPCVVVGLDYTITPEGGSYTAACLTLQLSDPVALAAAATAAAAAASEDPAASAAAAGCFQVVIPAPESGHAGFVILQAHFLAAVGHCWQVGDRVQSFMCEEGASSGQGTWRLGTVTADVRSDSPAGEVTADPFGCGGIWERYRVHWDSSGSGGGSGSIGGSGSNARHANLGLSQADAFANLQLTKCQQPETAAETTSADCKPPEDSAAATAATVVAADAAAASLPSSEHAVQAAGAHGAAAGAAGDTAAEAEEACSSPWELCAGGLSTQAVVAAQHCSGLSGEEVARLLPVVERLRHRSMYHFCNEPPSADALFVTKSGQQSLVRAYNRVVALPLGLKNIQERLEAGYYRSMQALLHDAALIARNAAMFNGTESPFSTRAMQAYNAIAAAAYPQEEQQQQQQQQQHQQQHQELLQQQRDSWLNGSASAADANTQYWQLQQQQQQQQQQQLLLQQQQASEHAAAAAAEVGAAYATYAGDPALLAAAGAGQVAAAEGAWYGQWPIIAAADGNGPWQDATGAVAFDGSAGFAAVGVDAGNCSNYSQQWDLAAAAAAGLQYPQWPTQGEQSALGYSNPYQQQRQEDEGRGTGSRRSRAGGRPASHRLRQQPQRSRRSAAQRARAFMADYAAGTGAHHPSDSSEENYSGQEEDSDDSSGSGRRQRQAPRPTRHSLRLQQQ